MNIHNLFIFNKSCICIYGLNLTNLYPLEQEQIISSYFTALMSFTKELIGNKIKTVEMGGGIKLVVFEKKNLLVYVKAILSGFLGILTFFVLLFLVIGLISLII